MKFEMNKSFGFLLAIGIAFASFGISKTLAADEAAGTTKVEKTIAVVNNEPIFSSELEKESEPFVERYQKTAPDKELTPDKMKDLKKEILDRLIEEKLLLQEAKGKKIRITKVEVEKGIEQFKDPYTVDAQGKQRPPAQAQKLFDEQLKKEGLTQEQFNKRVEEQMMKVKLIEQEVKSKVELPKDEEVKKFFEKIQKKMDGKPVEAASKEDEAELTQISKYLERMTGEQVRLRHILIRSPKTDSADKRAEAKKKAEDLLQKFKNGEDFAFLAKKYSEDQISKDRGGDLGFVAKGDLGLPEVDDAVFGKMKEGEISSVIETEIGYHLVKLIEKKAPHQMDYEDVAEDLKNYMAQRTFTQKLEKYLKDLRAKASIKVNPID